MDFVVSVPLDISLAELLGKKGSQNGITFYNRKEKGKNVVALAPSSIDDKFYALAESILIADQVVVSTADIGKLFGEVAVACSLIKRRMIFTDENVDKKMLGSVGITDYSVASRETLLNEILSFKHYVTEGETRIDLDKCFPVKGVGVVALGVVKSGVVHKHDKLYHSSGRQVEVRSIQSHDDDVDSADYGTRVGLALKGIEANEVDKGDLLTTSNIGEKNMIEVELKLASINKEHLQKGIKYALVSNFTYVYATVEKVDGTRVTLKLDTNASMVKGDELLLIRDASPRVFASGKVL
jgi:selenocysteine-specific translation elongation factor